jgi:sugar/nucleoside kinase (ribokinase family)
MSRWLNGAPDPNAADPNAADPELADPELADLTSAAEFAVRVAASVVTRFGARPTAPE